MSPPSFSMSLLPCFGRARVAGLCATALLLAGCTGSMGGSHGGEGDGSIPGGTTQPQSQVAERSMFPRLSHAQSHRIDSDGTSGPPIEGAQELHHQIDRIHARLFKHLLDRLSSYELGSGTLLDHGVAVWLNDNADKFHGVRKVPYILAGGAAGYLKTGQFVDVKITNNKLLNTIGAAVGCTNGQGGPLDDFGDEGLEGGLVDLIIA
jgi:hypothetical protein